LTILAEKTISIDAWLGPFLKGTLLFFECTRNRDLNIPLGTFLGLQAFFVEVAAGGIELGSPKCRLGCCP
jgi:hypothetical protein